VRLLIESAEKFFLDGLEGELHVARQNAQQEKSLRVKLEMELKSTKLHLDMVKEFIANKVRAEFEKSQNGLGEFKSEQSHPVVKIENSFSSVSSINSNSNSTPSDVLSNCPSDIRELALAFGSLPQSAFVSQKPHPSLVF